MHVDQNLKTLKSCLVLSGSELFRYRKPAEKTIPNVGGNKDFAPDGSWLQDKKLEKFYEERLELLGEQRVERIGNLVTGEWNPDKHLVELHKELGKFWVHMGFVDKSRKWLFPEEALYLMETNTLEVQYKGLPLSIQQAYRCFFDPEIRLEQYQVYTHLRRLGYTLIRHQGRCDITDYERKLKLDTYRKSKKGKSKKRKGTSEVDLTSSKVSKLQGDLTTPSGSQTDSDINNSGNKCLLEGNDSIEEGLMDWEENVHITPYIQDRGHITVDNTKIKQADLILPNRNLKCDNDSIESDEVIDKSLNITCASGTVTCLETTGLKKGQISSWDFSKISFPDIGQDQTLLLSESDKDKKLYPSGVKLPQVYTFDSMKYKQEVFNKKRSDEDFFDLDYSFPSCSATTKIKAKNWREYKEKLAALKDNTTDSLTCSPVAHLWAGDVQPLVKPYDGMNTATVLERLQVIKSLEEPQHVQIGKSSIQQQVIFDVYLPDCKFKKSSPGQPHHRLCVTRHSDPLPDLQTLSSLHQYYKDGIPLHWAVVDCGDIAFYDFTHIQIPDIL